MLSLSNKQKGDLYEFQIRDLLNANPDNHVWLWKDAPAQVLREICMLGDWNEYRFFRKTNKINNLPDLGGDLIVRNGNTYYLIQCKNYGDKNSITVDDLAGFFMLMSYNISLKGVVYYTSKLSPMLNFYKTDDRISFIQEKFIPPPSALISNEINDHTVEMVVNTMTNLLDNMHEYQRNAYTQLNGKHRAILQLPCGMGKTLISMKVAAEYDFVIIISPLKEYCQQNLECFKNEQQFQAYHDLLIDSDGTRDLNTIQTFLQTHTQCILSVTFKSVDIVNKFINTIDPQRLIVIIDEFHNLSQHDVLEMEDEQEEDTQKTPMNALLYNMAIRILFMSATPRIFENVDEIEYLNPDIFGNIEYSYEMSDAIHNKYICDYVLFIPDIYQNNALIAEAIRKEIPIDNLNDDMIKKIHFLIRGCLETGSRKCISYFQTQEEAMTFKQNLVSMNEYYYLDLFVDTILSVDTRNQRKEKITTFRNWTGIAFLCSVQILDECINIPSCDSIFMANPTNSKIRNIQRISRANRLDQNNPHKISNIFLWADEYNQIVQTIQHLKEYDQSFITEKIKILNSSKNGKCINQTDTVEEIKAKSELTDIVVGIKKVNGWFDMLHKVEQYVLEFNCLPSKRSTNNEIKKMGKWVSHQNENYKKKQDAMKTNAIYLKWTEFREQYHDLFLTNAEMWEISFQKVQQYVSEHGYLPSSTSTDNEIVKLTHWVNTQNQNYKKRSDIMKNDIIHFKWTAFREQYNELFLNNVEKWEISFQKVQQYVSEHGCLPVSESKDNEIKKLGQWISDQNKKYKKRTHIMKIMNVYDKWTAFREQYNELFLTNAEMWEISFQKVQQYVSEHGYLPSYSSKNAEIKKIGRWVACQNQNYKKRTDIMKNEIVYKKWTEFREQYNELFLSNVEMWEINFQRVQQYVSEHGCLPSSSSNDNEIRKIGLWVIVQNRTYKEQNCIMQDKNIHDKWTAFREQNKKLFLSNEEIWEINLENVKQYVLISRCLPSSKSKNNEIRKLGQWISDQNKNYKKQTHIMKIVSVYDKWTKFCEEFLILYK